MKSDKMIISEQAEGSIFICDAVIYHDNIRKLEKLFIF